MSLSLVESKEFYQRCLTLGLLGLWTLSIVLESASVSVLRLRGGRELLCWVRQES
jgi:hypothetical protein